MKTVRQVGMAALATVIFSLVACDQRSRLHPAGEADPAKVASQSLVASEPGGVLFVVGPLPLSAADTALKTRFESLGFAVHLKADDVVSHSDADGRDLVAISESARSVELGAVFRDVEVPVLSLEPAVWDDMNMAPRSSWDESIGDDTGTQVDIVSNYGPLTAGLSGAVTVAAAAEKLVWAQPTGEAIIAATISGASRKAAVFGYRAGAGMESGWVAPARRVAFFAGRDAPASFTAMGWRLFDAAVMWTANRAPHNGALFVVGTGPVSAADAAAKRRLAGLGFTVVLVPALETRTEDAAGMSLVVVSESVLSSQVGSKFRDVPVPVVAWEPSIWDDMRMVPPAGGWGEDIGDKNGQTEVAITTPGHPLAAGLSGTVVTSDVASKYVWARPRSPNVVVAATVKGEPLHAAIFGYDLGGRMEGGFVAPHRRVGFFSGQPTTGHFTGAGWKLFDAAITWATQAHILFVVGEGTSLSRAADAALAARMKQLSFAVRTIADHQTSTADAEGMSLVVVSESSLSSNVGTAFAHEAVPVLTLEPALQDDLGMTGSVWQGDQGTTPGTDRVVITNASHPLAAGLARNVKVSAAAAAVGWGSPSFDAHKVATDASFHATIYGYPAGANMVLGVAPARRTFFFAQRDAAIDFTQDGWSLFEAAVLWTSGELRPAPVILTAVGHDEPVPRYDSAAPIVVGADSSARYTYAAFTSHLNRQERAQIEALGGRFGRMVSSSPGSEVHELISLGDINVLAAALQGSTAKFHNLVPLRIEDKIFRTEDPFIDLTSATGARRVIVRCGDQVSSTTCATTVAGFVSPILDSYRNYFVGMMQPLAVEALARRDEISSVQEMSQPLATMENARVVSKVDAAQAFGAFPVLPSRSVSGGGILMGIYDSGVDPNHPAFMVPGSTSLREEVGRPWYTPTNYAPMMPELKAFSDHGTHVAGIAAGGGQGFTGGSFVQRGVAPAATIFSKEGGHYGVLEHGNVVNHSHINDRYGLYNESDADHDKALQKPWTYQDGIAKTMVIAAGNQGRENRMHGNLQGFYSILNNSKNAIIVGNLDGVAGYINETTSQGPTRDGRIKPDVVAPGTKVISCGFASSTFTDAPITFYEEKSGTSMAAPHVAGIAALMHQIERDRHPRCMFNHELCEFYETDALRNATVKAILIQTAEDKVHSEADAAAQQKPRNEDLSSTEGTEGYGFYAAGPDFSTGWGLVNADAATDAVARRDFSEHIGLRHGEVRKFILDVPAGAPLRVTVAWDDAPSTPLVISDSRPPLLMEARRLVNDIDIYLLDPAGNAHYPWRIAPFLAPFGSTTGVEVISKQRVRDNVATRSAVTSLVDGETNFDHLNNVERVDVDAPMAGTWTLVTIGRKIDSAQDFSLAHAGSAIELVQSRVAVRIRDVDNVMTGWVTDGETAGSTAAGDKAVMGIQFETHGWVGGYLGLQGRKKHATPFGESSWSDWAREGNELVTDFFHGFPITQLEFKLSNPRPIFETRTYEIRYRVFQEGPGWSTWGCGGSTAGTAGMPIKAVEMKLEFGAFPPLCP